jgi:hypothetical protein
MSLKSMQLLGSNKYIMNLYNFHFTEQGMRDAMREKFPGETTADIYAAIKAGLSGVSAAQFYDEYGHDDPGLEPLIPSGGGPGDCYRFHVLGSLTDDMKGVNESITLPVDFDYIPTQNQLDAALAKAAIDRYKQGPGSGEKYRNLPDPKFTPYETLLIEGC